MRCDTLRMIVSIVGIHDITNSALTDTPWICSFLMLNSLMLCSGTEMIVISIIHYSEWISRRCRKKFIKFNLVKMSKMKDKNLNTSEILITSSPVKVEEAKNELNIALV